MEQNLQVPTKKPWSMIQLILFIIRKNLSKTKLSLDLNLMIKRSKIAGKALQNLMLHHRSATAFSHRPPQPLTKHYEFLFTTVKKQRKKCAANNGGDETFVDPAMIEALEFFTSASASPIGHGLGRSPLVGVGKSPLVGVGKSPLVRQLRITDSPFPLSNEEGDSYVDEAAERFIMKFYNDLRRQG